MENNKHYKNIRQIEKERVFQLRQQEENDFWDEYKSSFIRYSSLDKFSSNKEEEEKNNNHIYEEKHEKIHISRPGLSVFPLRSWDYLHIIRGISFFSTKKYHELNKVISNSLFIKTMFKTQQLCNKSTNRC